MRHVTPTQRPAAHRQTARRRDGGSSPDVAPRIEPVEPRRLFAASIVLDGGFITATGTDGADTIKIQRVGFDDIRVTVNSLVRTFDLSDDAIAGYDLNGLGGNDNISAVGDFPGAVSPSVSIDGGAGTDTVSTNVALITRAEIIRDGIRTVATRQADGGLLVQGTSAGDLITLFGDTTEGAFVGFNSSFVGLFNVNEFTKFTVNGGDGSDALRVRELFPKPVFFNGQNGNDTFQIGDKLRATVTGGAGNDFLELQGAAGDDDLAFFDGGDGVDTIALGDETEGFDMRNDPRLENLTRARGTVIGNSLNNNISVGFEVSENVTIRGGGGNDTLDGGLGNDNLFGEEGNDSLYGDEGNDLLDGGPGEDFGDGGPGDDTLVSIEMDAEGPDPAIYIDRNGQLRAKGTAGPDDINIFRTGVDDVRVTVGFVGRTFDMDDFNSVFLDGLGGNDSFGAGQGIENVAMNGGAGHDRFSGNDQANTFIGGDGNDDIRGRGGNDAMFGDGGNDVLDGGAGNDYMEGGTGDDTLTGGAGADNLFGQAGNDTFFTLDGIKDILDGGPDTDRSQHDAIDERTSVEQTVP